MAERTVVARYQANIAQYQAAMAKLRHETRQASREITQAAAKNKQDWTQLGIGVGAAGAAIALGMGKAVQASMKFDQEMSRVQAATDATAHSMLGLREAALDAGARTAFSATEAAGAITELAKAGVSTADILAGGLDGALGLAAAGELEVATAAEIAASTLTQFALEGADVVHVADLLAAGANKAQGGVTDLGAALNQAGLVASQMGLSVEETVGALTAMASAGLLGSDAGTSLRTMLLRLANPTDEAIARFRELGISAYDAQGDFVGIESLAGQLQTRLGGLTQAQRDQTLALLFGQDAIRAANILYVEGAEGVRDWTDAVDDQGAAADTAAAKTDNLAGDLERLGGAWDSLLVDMGSNAQGPLRGLTQQITGVVEGLAEAPESMQNVALGLGGVASAAGLVAGGALLLLPRVADMRDAFHSLGISSTRVGSALGGVTQSLVGMRGLLISGVIAGGLYAVGEAAAFAAEQNSRFSTVLQSLVTSSASDARIFEQTVHAMNAAIAGTNEEGRADFWTDISDVLGVIAGGAPEAERGVSILRSAIEQLKATAPDTVEELLRLVEANGQIRTTAEGAIEVLGPGGSAALAYTASEAQALREELTTLTGSTEGAGSAAGGLIGEMDALGGEMGETATAGERLLQIIESLAGPTMDAQRAAIDYEQSLDDLRKTLKDNGDTLDLDTRKGRENRSAVLDNVDSIHEHVAALADKGASMKRLRATYDDHREDLRGVLEDAGFTKREIRDLIEQYELTPKDVETNIKALGVDQAAADIGRIQGALGGIGREIQEIGGEFRLKVDGRFAPGRFADGGIEQHIAQIAPAGAMRLWAEPETGGEAYIPLSPSKRPRSLSILNQVADMFGKDLVDTHYADGGINGTITASASAAITALTKMPDFGGNIVGLGRWLEQQGFRITGHSAWNGGRPITSGHATNSRHYRDLAIDANYGPPGASQTERDAIAALLPRVIGMTQGRLVENLHPFNDPSHDDHWHLAMMRGGILNPHVRDAGGPLLPGFTYNGTGRPETVLPFAGGGILGAASAAYANSPMTPQGMLSAISGAAYADGSVEALNEAIRLIDELTASWERAAEAEEDAARRAELVDQRRGIRDELRDAQAKLAKLDQSPETKAERQALAAAKEDVASLKERLGEASESLADFDADIRARNRDRRADRERERLEEAAATAQAEADAQARIDANRTEWEFEHASRDDQLAILDELIAAEEEFTDEWVRLVGEREQIREQETREIQQAADEARRVADEALSNLNAMLDEAQRIRAQMATNATDYANQIAAADRQLAADTAQVLADRQQAIESFAGLGQRVASSWGNSTQALIRNTRAQTQQLTEWAQGLQELRQRGLSEQIIAMMGLDTPGAETFGQVAALLRGSEEDIAEFNAAVVERSRVAGDQVAREQANLYGEVGRQLVDLRARHMDEMARLQEEFLASQAELQEQLETIGVEQGRGWADAIAEGILSGIPAIVAAAKKAQNAMNAVGGGSGGGSGSSGSGSSTVMAGNSFLGGSTDINDIRAHYGLPVYRRDEGGWLPNGALALNTSGQPEAVLTSSQLRQALSSAPQFDVQVFVGNEPIDSRINYVLRDRKTGQVIAGAR